MKKAELLAKVDEHCKSTRCADCKEISELRCDVAWIADNFELIPKEKENDITDN